MAISGIEQKIVCESNTFLHFKVFLGHSLVLKEPKARHGYHNDLKITKILVGTWNELKKK